MPPTNPTTELTRRILAHPNDEDAYLVLADLLQQQGDPRGEFILLRTYYDDYQISPTDRVLTKAMAKSLGRNKGNTKYLYQLFPYGPAKQAIRYAGLPKPTC